ncbi:tyrosine-type recombinase/integrase [Corynebacterium flavescens]|uniref:tyrosine-type recombinase/integrase n=1 Tax=Corynebacterium flavescens TaxID=28028 RepID=UPI003FD5DCD4
MVRGRPATPLGTHGEIHISERPDGKVRARAYLRLYTGKTVQVVATATSRTAAKRQLEQRCQARLQGADTATLSPASRLTDLLDEWLKAHDAGDRTKEIYKQNIRLHVAPALGEVRLNELNTPRIQEFLAEQTPGTAKTARALLGAACGLGVRWGLMPQNPVRDTQLKKRRKAEVHALTDSEMNEYRARVEAWCGTGRSGPPRGESLLEIIDVLRGTGARIGEVLALRWQDIDLDGGTVTITGTVDNQGGRSDHPKTLGSRRTIPAGKYAIDALRRQWQKEYRPTFGDIVFPTRTGRYRTVQNTESRLRAARGDLTIRPHDFRKSVATRIEARHGLLAASRYLGHASTRVTEAAYLAAPEVIGDYTDAFETDTGH